MPSTKPFYIRKAANRKAVVLIHGFGGSSYLTFGLLPAFLAGKQALYEWDIWCFGFPTSLAPDISGVWTADPDLTVLTGRLVTAILETEFRNYESLALVGHSMGGLIAQRAVLDPAVRGRIGHVILFGTPSGGLRKARLARLFKRQVRDMAYRGEFITALRANWDDEFRDGTPFGCCAVAGIRDQFVPAWSSVAPFPESSRRYVDGNHLEIVKPQSAESDSILLLVHRLTASASDGGDRSSGAFFAARQSTASALWKKRPSLPQDELVRLVLALELTGDADKALELLDKRYQESTELTGVYAGRLKRRWLSDPDERSEDGARARELYQEAFERADEHGDHEQALYNGINAAFMRLAIDDDGANAAAIARLVLDHCEQVAEHPWQLPARAEAHLYLGQFDEALSAYETALRQGEFDERETDAIQQQAYWAARLLGDDELEARLRLIFTR